MTDFLVKLFVKNHQDTDNTDVRTKLRRTFEHCGDHMQRIAFYGKAADWSFYALARDYGGCVQQFVGRCLFGYQLCRRKNGE